MQVTIYHNPKCSTSRNALEIIRAKGIAPTIIEYLKTPLTRAELVTLIAKMKVPVGDIVRAKEPVYAELGLDGASDDALLDAMVQHPILMNRPIVVTEKGARLFRPSEVVGEVL